MGKGFPVSVEVQSIGLIDILLAEIADDEITNQIKQINISTANFRKNFKKAKNESNRLIKGANLELIQLMEQGDHVIKPIWTSWQFGSNSYYNGWNGFYNGRGDKGNSVDKFFNRSNNAFARNVSPLSSKSRMLSPYLRGSLYGTTWLKDVEEPIVEWEVTPGINPRRVEGIAPLVLASRQEINFQNPEMPTFEVPDGAYFCLGDNRNSSEDSRRWVHSYVYKEKIIAKVIFRYFPGFKILK